MNGTGWASWSWREGVTIGLVAICAAVALTWPVALHPSSRLGAPVGPGDPFLNLWILGWDLGTTSHDPLALLTGRVFDANIFFPAERTLAYSDHLILQAALVWPLWATTGDVVLCYNALLVLSLAACVMAMYAFARLLTGSRGGALVAGLAWGFMPFHFAHLLHLQLQSLYLLPLAFLCLHRLVAARRRRDAVALGVAAGLQAISSVYWGVVGAVAIAVGTVALNVAVGRWRSALMVRRLLLAGVVGGVLVAPFAWPYWQVQQREGFARNLYEAAQHEAVAASYLRVPPGNLLYGRTGWLRPGPATPGAAAGQPEGPEQELFPGFVLLGLAAVGAWRGVRGARRPAAVTLLCVAGAGGVLSFGPDGARGLYALLHRVVFGFQAVRAPARFGVLVAFGLAGLAAMGVEAIERRWRARRPGREAGALGPGARVTALAVGVAVLVALEYVNVPVPTVPAPARRTPVGQWLAAAPGPGAVLYLPLDGDAGNTVAMVDALQHRRPVVNGYSGQRPAFFPGLVDALNLLPAPEALGTLHDMGVRFVVSQRDLAPPAGGPLVERARLEGRTVYELVWTPATEAAVARPEAPAPPAAGALPFAVSERVVYRVLWRGGPSVSVAAGQATFTATRGDAGALRLAVDLETAAWVAGFFEARDRLETWVDAAWLPLRQEQHLREGRRVVDRVVRFDPARRTVTLADGPALPLPREARDGLAAFYYARTLPLSPGYTARFPVSEGGRTYVVDLGVEGIEPVTVGGRRVSAFKVVPRVGSSRDPRRAVQATLWISQDARRVPLVLEVETAFGAFRADLDAYQAR